MLDERFILLGAVLNLIGTSTYVYATLKGRTRPNRVSWLLWALAPFIAFSAQISQGVGLTALVTFMSGFCPALILLASFVNRKSYWAVTRFDLICGGLSLLALILWAVTRTGNVAISLAIAADGLAAVPTLIKAYREPHTESPYAFLTGGASALIGLLAIKTWNFEHYAFPLYLVLICAVLFTLIKFPNLRPPIIKNVKHS